MDNVGEALLRMFGADSKAHPKDLQRVTAVVSAQSGKGRSDAYQVDEEEAWQQPYEQEYDELAVENYGYDEYYAGEEDDNDDCYD
eukprot:12938078-Prorocentrum_lima.AAC.1